jgi:hypothetical protein
VLTFGDYVVSWALSGVEDELGRARSMKVREESEGRVTSLIKYYKIHTSGF